jgi:hypothetical protein
VGPTHCKSCRRQQAQIGPAPIYLRVDGSYDSIGTTGLDMLPGLIRSGMTF